MSLELHVDRRGHGPRVVLVHGFTQTANSWARLAGDLEGTFEVIAVDLPGHGRSPRADPDSHIAATASALGAAGGRAAYVGYSLGGRGCLHLALETPELVERLVIIGAHPGITDALEREARARSDEALAAELEDGGEAFVPSFVDKWLDGPLFDHLSEQQADRPSRLLNTAAGLASSLRTAGTGTQLPVWDRLFLLEMPVLVVVGELDAKFRPVAEHTAEAIGANARLAVVKGAGHAACFERPEEFLALLGEFLDPRT